jgi:hypothetical protein
MNRSNSHSLERAGKYVLLLFAVCFFALPSSTFGATHGSSVATHLLRAGTPAVADLDGDQLPDLASGIKTGHTSQGYSYRVDLDLTGNPDRKSFSVLSQEPNGLNIQAIDVDGDKDLDLVITSRWSMKPIGVWINDGSGSFTPGDLDQYGSRIWQTSPSVRSSHLASNIVLQHEWRRLDISISSQRLDFGLSDFRLLPIGSVSLNTSRIPLGSAQLRAPPISNV